MSEPKLACPSCALPQLALSTTDTELTEKVHMPISPSRRTNNMKYQPHPTPPNPSVL